MKKVHDLANFLIPWKLCSIIKQFSLELFSKLILSLQVRREALKWIYSLKFHNSLHLLLQFEITSTYFIFMADKFVNLIFYEEILRAKFMRWNFLVCQGIKWRFSRLQKKHSKVDWKENFRRYITYDSICSGSRIKFLWSFKKHCKNIFHVLFERDSISSTCVLWSFL